MCHILPFKNKTLHHIYIYLYKNQSNELQPNTLLIEAPVALVCTHQSKSTTHYVKSKNTTMATEHVGLK